MCLITLIPKGKEKNIESIAGFVEQGMKTNIDGSGIGYKKDGILSLKKGFRSVHELVRHIKDLELGVDDELMIHHRNGTSGLYNNINMHPFIVSDNEDILKTTEMLDIKLFPLMAHNGVFHSFTDRQSEMNDTMHFVKDYMSTPQLISLLKENPAKFEKICKSTLCNAKLSFLFHDRNSILIGNFTEDDGIYHSNDGYKKSTYDKGGYGFFNGGLNYYKQNRIWNFETKEYEGVDIEDAVYKDNHVEVEPGIDNKLERYAKLTKTLLAMNPDKIKRSKGNAIKFEGRDIKITKKNFNHFIFVVKGKDYSNHILKNQGFEIENYDELTALTAIMYKGQSKQLFLVDLDSFMSTCEIYVKHDYKIYYDAYFDLINEKGYNPTKSSVKKIKKALDVNFKRESFKYKGYGGVFSSDLRHYFNQVKGKLNDPENNLEIKDTYIIPEHEFTPISEIQD